MIASSYGSLNHRRRHHPHRYARVYTKLRMEENSPDKTLNVNDANDMMMMTTINDDQQDNVNKDTSISSSQETDSFGMVRLVVASILGLGGILNLAKDASHVKESVTGGYILGSVITLTIDIAFTLAMAGAVYKEYQMQQSKE
jgi:hypothetical protein